MINLHVVRIIHCHLLPVTPLQLIHTVHHSVTQHGAGTKHRLSEGHKRHLYQKCITLPAGTRGMIRKNYKYPQLHMACGYWKKPETRLRKQIQISFLLHCSCVLLRGFWGKYVQKSSLELLGCPVQSWTLEMSEASVLINVHLSLSVVPLPTAVMRFAYVTLILHTAVFAKFKIVQFHDTPALSSFQKCSHWFCILLFFLFRVTEQCKFCSLWCHYLQVRLQLFWIWQKHTSACCTNAQLITILIEQ